MSKYTNKETGEVIEAIQLNNLKEIDEFTNGYFTVMEVDEGLYSPDCLYKVMITMRSHNKMLQGLTEDYLYKTMTSYDIAPKDFFEKHFEKHEVKPKLDIPAAKQIIQLHLNTDEYTKLIEEAKNTVAKLNNITKRLKNPTVETRRNSNDAEIVLKPRKNKDEILADDAKKFIAVDVTINNGKPISEEDIGNYIYKKIVEARKNM